MLIRRRQPLSWVLLLATVLAALTVATASSAAADDCTVGDYEGGGSGGGSYGQVCPTDDDPVDDTPTGPPGPSGPIAPTCNLAGAGGTDYSDQNRGPNFCMGENVCFNTDLLDLSNPPAGDPPSENGKGRVTWCYDGIMGPPSIVRIFWSDEEEPPSLLDQAREAIGTIELGGAEIQISPDGRTLVNLDTWYWLEGAQQEVTGSSAFGLVAIATFGTMTVDPGDGSGSFTCPLVTSSEQAEESCAYSYRRASNSGSATVDGRPAYRASVTAVYELRFEINGTPTQVPGAPATLEAPPAGADLRVDEIQSRVTGLG